MQDKFQLFKNMAACQQWIITDSQDLLNAAVLHHVGHDRCRDRQTSKTSMIKLKVFNNYSSQQTLSLFSQYYNKTG